ncbi:MAG: NADH-quinone oxidoreductase subunit L [Chthonomonas sp.]|nr:NADH-quinone oxidoreductase subunit L [Chthonomonas sp.]
MAENTKTLILLVLLLPLLGFLVQSLLGGRIVKSGNDAAGKRIAGFLAVLPIAASFVIGAIITAGLVKAPAGAHYTYFNWIEIQSLVVPFELRVDQLSMTMVLIITGLGSLIHLFATGYMAEEKEYTRFFTYLNLFIAFMLILVLGNNLAMLFIGWEGVGLCSYLLIGFWYKDLNNSRAANKAFIVNRIGDWGLTLGLFMAAALLMANLSQLGDIGGRFLSYDVLLSEASLNVFKSNPEMTTVIALLLFVGAMGKSAQFPLYIWLPDAMAGPTPVSALIHAATMVTSGIVLLNRMAPIFAMSPTASGVVMIVGAFTALFAALIAFGQRDIKKVLAYSTVSQLGYMFIACGAGAYWVGMFHVITHAFFKALLFLGSGAVIHAMAHEQDMRWYGNLKKYIPITTMVMTIGWLAIAGFPFMAGAFSKESILGAAFGNHLAEINGVQVGAIAGWIAVGVALLTAAYMTRMTMLTFYGGEERWRELGLHSEAHHDHDHDHHEHHAHAHAHEDHGPDTHGFFYTDEEMAAQHEEHEHHHHLDAEYTPHEVSPSMWVPLAILAVLSVIGGAIFYNVWNLEKWLYPNGVPMLDPELAHGHPASGFLAQHFGPTILGVHINGLFLVATGAGVLGMLIGYIIYRKGMPKREKDEATMLSIQRAAGNQFGYDSLMVNASVEGGEALADKFFFRFLDSKVVDGIVNGVGVLSTKLGSILKIFQTGYVRSYALLMMVGVLGLLVSMVIQMMNGGAH